MSFMLSEHQRMGQKRFREFAEKEVKPLAEMIDKEERFPIETISKLKELGWLGLPFAKEYGGQNLDTLTYILCVEELSKVCASTGVILSTHTSLCADTIKRMGNPDQLRQYLLPLAKGTRLGAFALTERNAGTDVSGVQTTAMLEGDYYILNGQKIFITNAGEADVYIVFAMTNPGLGAKGLSAFIVEKGFTGFQIGKKINKMGIRGSITRELIFEGCIVPRRNLLGDEGKGFEIAMQALNGGRIGIAAQALGIAQGAFDETVRYVTNRKQFGKAIADFQNTRFQLANMKTKIEAARLLVYRAAETKDDNNRHYSEEAAMAKLFASETAMEVTNKCVQLHGGYGYTTDHPVERMMRDAKITEIYEGTNEVQRMILSAGILK